MPLIATALILAAGILGVTFAAHQQTGLPSLPRAGEAQGAVYLEDFDTPFMLEESEGPDTSEHKALWLNSGAYFFAIGGEGKSMQGGLAERDRWRLAYASSNAPDTDEGAHPQNVFRLFTRDEWRSPDVSAYVYINKIHEGGSPNRDGSDGILLMSRYQDGDDLYYAGVRADGYAVIKKKEHGAYETLAEKKIFKDAHARKKSDRSHLPVGVWFGLRSVTTTTEEGASEVALYIDTGRTGEWLEVLRVRDHGSEGRPPFLAEGMAGIRSDYMDISIDDVLIIERAS